MRITAMLAFFEEEPDMIGDAISHVAALGVDRLVAIDGPYDLYPTERNQSSHECLAAVMSAATAGIPHVDLVKKLGNWSGNEVEKRNFMLELALDGATQDDWLLVFDSDHIWGSVSADDSDLKSELSRCHQDFAEVLFADGMRIDGSPAWYEARLLQRAVQGMRYDGSHWLVRHPDGTACSTLRSGARDTDAPVASLAHSFFVWHAINDRSSESRSRQSTYYGRRDTSRAEKAQRADYDEET